uniref:Fe-Mn family superoxide dismutase n=1 Tax=Alistipes sp. TaxID=1872444 RepID=UPI0040575F34
MKKFLAYFIPILLAFAVGALGSYIQGDALVEWYPYLVKSPATPPAIVFPIAWGILYILIGISAGTMLSKGDMSVLRLWLLQLLLNFLWSVCFFALRSPFMGLLVILALDVTVFAYIVYTTGRRSAAAWLFVPYMLWLIFATYLNGYIYINNKKPKEKIAMSTTATKFALPALPYAANALAPIMSEETINYHYGKHFKTYIDNTNRLIEGTPYEGMGLEEIVKKSDGAIFNNAAQALNHRIYFDGLTPTPQPIPERLYDRIVRDFGSVDNFNKQFVDTAVSVFGSGWVWLAEDSKGKLSIVPTKDADNPLRHHLNPLMCVDVWEHAYYLDYQNRRADFIKEYMKLIDWNRANSRLKS